MEKKRWTQKSWTDWVDKKFPNLTLKKESPEVVVPTVKEALDQYPGLRWRR
jgi:hypothetical protein